MGQKIWKRGRLILTLALLLAGVSTSAGCFVNRDHHDHDWHRDHDRDYR